MKIDTDRLMKLATEGDAQAAMTLRARAKRTGDNELVDFLRGVRDFYVTKLQQETQLWNLSVQGLGAYAVVLTSIGEKKIQVIKEVRALSGRGLKEAKSCVDNLPSLVGEHVEADVAERFCARLQAIGATAVVHNNRAEVKKAYLYLHDDGHDRSKPPILQSVELSS